VLSYGGQTFTVTQNTFANINARALYPGFSPPAFELFAQDANSHYNAFQLTVKHRFTGGLYLQSAYTFSKSMDDTSTGSAAFDTRFNDQSTGRDTRSVSDYDRPHRFVTTYGYTLPFYKGQHGAAAALLGGWDVSGVFTLQSGTPFSVYDSLGGSVYGLSSPNLVTPTWVSGFSCSNAETSGGILSRLNGYIDRAAFVNDPPVANSPDGSTGFGNVPRNCIRGPHQFNIDFSINKVLQLTETQHLKFTTEFFNLTNTPSFQNPGITDINSPAFGQINSVVGTPRLVQFALRYSF